MKGKIVDHVFLFSSMIIIILTVSLSCIRNPLKLTSTQEADKKVIPVEKEDDEIDYPSMEYKGQVIIDNSGQYGKYEAYENIFMDIDASKIKVSTELKSFTTLKKTSLGKDSEVSTNVEESIKKLSGSSEYVRSNTEGISQSEYSKIKTLFMFVSKVSVYDTESTNIKNVEFSKGVPFLPKTSESIASFLNLKDDVSFSYVYKDDGNFSKGVSITTKISVSEEEDNTISVKLDNTVQSMDEIHAADFWSNSVFPNTSIYYIDKDDRKIKTMKSSSWLIMSKDPRGGAHYFDKSNKTLQETTTKLCKYKTKKGTDSFDCE